MKRKQLIWTSIFLLNIIFAFGQSDSTQTVIVPEQVDSIQNLIATPTAKKKKGNFVSRYFKKDYPSPKKAVILTAILPGLGQVYNKKHWYFKLPIIYGAFGGLIYSISENRSRYLDLRREHRFIVDGLDCTTSIYEGLVTADVLKNARDQRWKWMQMSYIGIGLAYILTAAEAYSTAHLLSFDVSDDLSLQLKPSIDYSPVQGTILGFGINLKIGKTKTHQPKIIFNQN